MLTPPLRATAESPRRLAIELIPLVCVHESCLCTRARMSGRAAAASDGGGIATLGDCADASHTIEIAAAAGDGGGIATLGDCADASHVCARDVPRARAQMLEYAAAASDGGGCAAFDGRADTSHVCARAVPRARAQTIEYAAAASDR